MAATYEVRFERDPESQWWVAHVPAVQGVHTQGRTLEEARRRVREALSLFVDDADTATLVDDIRMPSTYKRAVENFTAARDEAEKVQAVASARARHAVQLLADGTLRLSRRDAAEVLGMSHQRVQQLLDGAAATKAKPRHAIVAPAARRPGRNAAVGGGKRSTGAGRRRSPSK
jgi:predicted RNase H-like HicB family nuclease